MMSRGVRVEENRPIDEFLLVHFVTANTHAQTYAIASGILASKVIMPFTMRERILSLGSDDDVRMECETKLAKAVLAPHLISSHELSLFSLINLSRLVPAQGEAYGSARSISFGAHFPFVAISRTIKDENQLRDVHGIAPDFRPFYAILISKDNVRVASTRQELEGTYKGEVHSFLSPFFNYSFSHQPPGLPSQESFTSLLPNGAMLATPYRVVLPND